MWVDYLGGVQRVCWPPPPPLTLLGGGPVHVHICFYKTGIKPADCQILFYHTTRGLEWETVLCMIIAPSEGF